MYNYVYNTLMKYAGNLTTIYSRGGQKLLKPYLFFKIICEGKYHSNQIEGDEETETVLAHPGDKRSGTFPTRL